MNCRTVIWGSVATLGVILIAAGITLTQIGDGIVEDLVHQKLSLTDETSDGYKYFVSNHFYLFKTFHLFLLHRSLLLFLSKPTSHSLKWRIQRRYLLASPPIFKVIGYFQAWLISQIPLAEKGPYVFTEHREKRNINRTGTSIKYGKSHLIPQ